MGIDSRNVEGFTGSHIKPIPIPFFCFFPLLCSYLFHLTSSFLTIRKLKYTNRFSNIFDKNRNYSKKIQRDTLQ